MIPVIEHDIKRAYLGTIQDVGLYARGPEECMSSPSTRLTADLLAGGWHQCILCVAGAGRLTSALLLASTRRAAVSPCTRGGSTQSKGLTPSLLFLQKSFQTFKESPCPYATYKTAVSSHWLLAIGLYFILIIKVVYPFRICCKLIHLFFFYCLMFL